MKGLKRWTGIVSRMAYKEGYGMITVPPDRKEYFFHASDVRIVDEDKDPVFEDFNTGDPVTFVPLRGERGWKALGVRKMENSNG